MTNIPLEIEKARASTPSKVTLVEAVRLWQLQRVAAVPKFIQGLATALVDPVHDPRRPFQAALVEAVQSRRELVAEWQRKTGKKKVALYESHFQKSEFYRWQQGAAAGRPIEDGSTVDKNWRRLIGEALET